MLIGFLSINNLSTVQFIYLHQHIFLTLKRLKLSSLRNNVVIWMGGDARVIIRLCNHGLSVVKSDIRILHKILHKT